MNHETHKFPRFINWVSIPPAVVLLLIQLRDLWKYGADYSTAKIIMTIVVGVGPLVMAIGLLLRRQVWEVSWSAERLQVRQGKKQLLDHEWAGGLLYAEDQKTYAVTPRQHGRTVYLLKTLCSPGLTARLKSYLPAPGEALLAPPPEFTSSVNSNCPATEHLPDAGWPCGRTPDH